MIEVYTGHLTEVEPAPVKRTPEEAAWLAYVARHDRIAAARPALSPAEKDALRREFGYPTPHRRWWRR